MPAIVAIAIRYIIIASVQLGIFAFLENVIMPKFNDAIAAIMEFFGVPEEEAKDIMANEWIEAMETIGIFAATIATKTPVKVAEKLGFTTKGWGKRPLKGKTAEKVKNAKAAKSSVVTSAVSKLDQAAKWAQISLSVLGLPVGIGLLITNTIDFGAWPSSAYQTAVQNFLAKFGLKPDAEARQPRTTSAEMFTKIYTAFKNQGVTALNDPYKQQSVVFSRDALLDLSDRLAGDMLLQGKTVTVKMMIAALLPLTNLKPGDITAAAAAAGGAATASPSVPTVKVFTGVMSQGVLGEKIAFQERQDDLITSMDELTQAAQNNLAPWLSSLLGRIIYEVKLTNSVMTKDGTTLNGSSQQVISGYDTKGNARYKTVRNKFAIMNLYAMTDKGTRVKLAQITLGPTDAIQLQPTLNQLAELTTKIGSQVLTSDVKDIAVIATASPIAIATPQAVLSASAQINQPLPSAPVVAPTTQAVPTLTVGAAAAPQAVSAPTPSAPAPVVKQKPATCSAGTLFDYYSAKGMTLPSLSERGRIYQAAGLGLADYYAGTAEQNTKLLRHLQGNDGC